MFLRAVAERRNPQPLEQPPVMQRAAPQRRATFPPDGMTPATPDQIRSFFTK